MKSLCIQEIKKIENKINQCKNMNIEDINYDDIDNIDDITINSDIPPEDRIINFLNSTKNPYFFRINDTIVKFSFSENDITADECVENVMRHLISK